MVNYADAKIYRIVCNSTGLTYYGSTTQPLSKRLYQHKNLKCTSKIIIDKGNYDIVLVETFSCNSKEELHLRERFFIENNECVNKRIPTRTLKEYYDQNKDQIKEYNKEYYKEYYEQNKDQLNIKSKEYREHNKDQINIQYKEYREQNKDQLKIKNKEYYEHNKDKIKIQRRKNYKKKLLDIKQDIDIVANTID